MCFVLFHLVYSCMRFLYPYCLPQSIHTDKLCVKLKTKGMVSQATKRRHHSHLFSLSLITEGLNLLPVNSWNFVYPYLSGELLLSNEVIRKEHKRKYLIHWVSKIWPAQPHHSASSAALGSRANPHTSGIVQQTGPICQAQYMHYTQHPPWPVQDTCHLPQPICAVYHSPASPLAAPGQASHVAWILYQLEWTLHAVCILDWPCTGHSPLTAGASTIWLDLACGGRERSRSGGPTHLAHELALHHSCSPQGQVSFISLSYTNYTLYKSMEKERERAHAPCFLSQQKNQRMNMSASMYFTTETLCTECSLP